MTNWRQTVNGTEYGKAAGGNGMKSGWQGESERRKEQLHKITVKNEGDFCNDV